VLLAHVSNRTIHTPNKRKEKKNYTCVACAGSSSRINSGKGDALARSDYPSPIEKITSGDLEDGWQPPAPDQLALQGLESLFFQVRVLFQFVSIMHGVSMQFQGSHADPFCHLASATSKELLC